MTARFPWPLKLFVALSYVILLAPIVVVVAVSFGPGRNFEFPPTGLTLTWYEAFFASRDFVRAFFRNSLTLGIEVAIVSTLLGTLAAIGLIRFRFPARDSLEAFFLAPLFIPEILLGAALFLTYAQLGLRPSLITVLMGHVVICTPYVLRSVIAGLSGFDTRLEEAARSLGATSTRAFTRIVLPALQASIVGGFVFAFVISFSDINIVLFVSGPTSATLPVYIYSLLQFEATPSVAAASTLQIVVVGLLILGLQQIFRTRSFA